MGEGVEHHRGGIRALGELIRQHPGEIRHLLVTSGLRWRDHGCTWDWADLAALVRFAPRESPIRTATQATAQWGQVEHMLADLFDAVRLLSWQQAGGRGSRPKSYPRPGDRTVQRFGKARLMTRAEARRARARARRGEGVRDVGQADAVR